MTEQKLALVKLAIGAAAAIGADELETYRAAAAGLRNYPAFCRRRFDFQPGDGGSWTATRLPETGSSRSPEGIGS